MRWIGDLHIHSRFSRSCSSDLSIPNLEKWARIKGVDFLGTGDFTHPKWSEEIKNHLKEDGTGIMRTEKNFPFVLQTEISLMYKQADKGRRIHLILLVPSLEIVEQIKEYLGKHGRLDYDGRPIFKIPAHDLVYDLRNISTEIEIIPAHIWTPWFSLFGSKSGFDSVHNCFKDQGKYIHAMETGLSSDPPMNWRLSQLDKFKLVSFSDLHSFWPWRMGREATLFEFSRLTYKNLLKAFRSDKGLSGTIEVDPSYGKYHYDGHRNCNVVMKPSETKKHHDICPVCKKPLTLGVAYRVEELADREEGYKPVEAKPFYKMLPLSEILSGIRRTSVNSKTVWKDFNKLLQRFKSEYNILLDGEKDKLSEEINPKIAEAIIQNRKGNLKVNPGYDGVYGELQIEKVEKEDGSESVPPKQKGLGDFI